MTLLTIEKLRKAFGPHVIFDEADLHINAKQKIGVIGRNGAGKSTLFKMIVGEDEQDSGEVTVHTDTRLGYLEQHDTVSDLPVQQFLEEVSGKESWQCAKIAGMFDIKHEMLEMPVSSLSGGYQMRIKLSAMLLKDPNLFLLDEPTNYLDVHTQLLLERFLQSYTGAFLIISHDREFLERTCEQTLDVEGGKMFLYPGPVTEYLEFKEAQAVYAQKFNEKVDRERKHLQTFVDRFRYKASKAAQAQSKMKAISRLKTVDIASPLKVVRISIPGKDTRKGQVLRVKNMSIGYGDKVVASEITVDANRGDHVAIIGDNGQGKTTFLKTLADELPPLAGSGSWAADTSIAYYAQHVPSSMNPLLSAWEYLRAMAPRVDNEDVMRMAGNFLFTKESLLKKISVLSGGERARLCLAGILLSESQVLILDEPTNHLDFETVEALEQALEAFQGTVFFVSHNRAFVNSLATAIFEVGGGKVQRFNGTYDEYVWKLEQSLDPIKENATKQVVAVAPAVSSKHARFEDVKEAKRKLRLIEEAIVDFQKIQRKLETKQAKNPEKFMHTDYAELGEVIRAIAAKEEEWLDMQAHIEAMSR